MTQNNRKMGAQRELDPSQPQRIPEGFLLVDRSTGWWVYSIIFVIGISFVVSFGIYLITGFIVALLFLFSTQGLWSILVVLITGCLSGVFIWLAAKISQWFIKRISAVIHLFPGELILPKFPLRLGEACHIRYRRQLRRGQTLQLGRVSAQLICYEWVEYSVGSGTSTATHTLWEQSLPVRDVPAGLSKVEYDCQIQIPQQEPPSFAAKNNQIRWEVRVLLDLPELAKDTSNFRLTVEPEVMA